MFFHFVAERHEHTALTLRPGQLYQDGMFALSRNPNYFGELPIYLALALLALLVLCTATVQIRPYTLAATLFGPAPAHPVGTEAPPPVADRGRSVTMTCV